MQQSPYAEGLVQSRGGSITVGFLCTLLKEVFLMCTLGPKKAQIPICGHMSLVYNIQNLVWVHDQTVRICILWVMLGTLALACDTIWTVSKSYTIAFIHKLLAMFINHLIRGKLWIRQVYLHGNSLLGIIIPILKIQRQQLGHSQCSS